MRSSSKNPVVISPSTAREADIAMRGILIAAIVLGHNRLLTEQVPWLFGFVYKWHVHGFFFLALAARGVRTGSPRPADILVRFMVPFCLFVTAATVLNALRGEFSATAYIAALGIGSARLVNAACDMSLFWFLPAFAGFLLVSGRVGQLISRSSHPGGLLTMICLTCTLVSIAVPRTVALYIPLGLPIVAYILPAAIIFCLLNEQLERLTRWQSVFAAAVCAGAFSLSYSVLAGAHLDISLFKFGQGSLSTFAAGIVVSISAGLFLKALLLAFRQDKASVLSRMGQASLLIFLVHSFIQAPLAAAAGALLRPNATTVIIPAALGIAAVAIAAGMYVDFILRRRPALRGLILPYDRDEFLAALRCLRRDPFALGRRVEKRSS